MAADTNISVDGINLNGFICILLLIIYKISYIQRGNHDGVRVVGIKFQCNFLLIVSKKL